MFVTVQFFVASVTPFDQEGKFNPTSMEKLMERHIKEGADGFFIGGSTGECFLLTQEERIGAFGVASQFADRSTIYAHIGAVSTPTAVELAIQARILGIKHISATPPFYFALSPKEVRAYYSDLSNAAQMPVLFYNIPSSTYFNLDLDNPDIRALLCSGAISGVKHISLNLYQIERIRNINPDLVCYGGYENSILPFLAHGCDGFIGSSFNCMLPQYKKMATLYTQGTHKEALALQRKANNILDALFKTGIPAGLKYILRQQGNDVGNVRAPLLPLDDATQKKLSRIWKENQF